MLNFSLKTRYFGETDEILKILSHCNTLKLKHKNKFETEKKSSKYEIIEIIKKLNKEELLVVKKMLNKYKWKQKNYFGFYTKLNGATYEYITIWFKTFLRKKLICSHTFKYLNIFT